MYLPVNPSFVLFTLPLGEAINQWHGVKYRERIQVQYYITVLSTIPSTTTTSSTATTLVSYNMRAIVYPLSTYIC